MHVILISGWSWHLILVPAAGAGRLRWVPGVINDWCAAVASVLVHAACAVRLSLARSAGSEVPSGLSVEVFACSRAAPEVAPKFASFACSKPAPALREASLVLVARKLGVVFDIAASWRSRALMRARRPYASLVVPRSGREEPSLRYVIYDTGLHDCVQFSGQRDREQAAAEVQHCYGTLIPSRVDSMPSAIFQAPAGGVLVVSTRVGRVSFRVEDGNTALLVPLGVVAVMFEPLMRVLGAATLADPSRAAGQRSAVQWSWASASRPWPRFTNACCHEVRPKVEQRVTRSKACVRKRTSGG